VSPAGRNDALREQVSGMIEAVGLIAATELADLVAYVTSRPRHVNLRQVMVLPTAQV
jgi:NADP-dependent 3-hydroxy acid dehydrogenase YdfG